jgi:uncharacterized protein YjiS (DUF1127 family)
MAMRLRRVAVAFSEHRRRRRDYLLLQDMPQSLLEDIGLTRADIRAAARWSFF